MPTLHWLSYGGGVNSTALLILLAEGKLPQFEPWRAVFADTLTEKDATYAYIEKQIKPWLAARGRELETARASEGVLERWERFKMTGSRIIRSCTDYAKVRTIKRWRNEHTPEGWDQVSLIGIDAGEPHRARPAGENEAPKVYPLVDLGIDRDGCKQIIKAAGLCVPAKSGCWCCPFMRVNEVIALARDEPEKFERIARLEAAANAEHGPAMYAPGSREGKKDPVRPRTQFRDKPTDYWRERAKQPIVQALGFDADDDDEGPCECFK